MTKLIIQIPCWNEEGQLPVSLAALPRALPGIDVVEWLIIDDGSTDDTIAVARSLGVDHVVRLTNHKGLAHAFQAGIDACLKLGADVIVNTDADNQYCADDIGALVAPVLEGTADMVVGDRHVDDIAHFSWSKKRLQHLGSWVARGVSRTAVADATSGFRAYSRQAAQALTVVTSFTYTLETLIQAGRSDLAVVDVRVRTNPEVLRESRLFGSTWGYVRRNSLSMVRIYTTYRPLRVFSILAAVLAVGGLAAWSPFLFDWIVRGDRSGRLQSVILGAVLIIASLQVFALGVIADLIATQRTLAQRTLERVRGIELRVGVPPAHYEPGKLGSTEQLVEGVDVNTGERT
jgi:glycosyltransferase involved in cell wall biosynthesis